MPFRTIFGHRQLLHLLSGSIARERLPQSLLFAGPEGVGKRRTAVAVAQALNCLHTGARGQELGAGMSAEARGRRAEAEGQLARRSAPEASEGEWPVDACGECSVCRRIERGVFPDVVHVEPDESGSIKIDQVRATIGETTFRPFEGRRRVVIIDEADRMGPDAQDALLKSLEEPTPHSVFILDLGPGGHAGADGTVAVLAPAVRPAEPGRDCPCTGARPGVQ